MSLSCPTTEVPLAGVVSSHRRRVLFVGEGVTLAHVLRPLALAQSLDPARYDAVFACDPRHRAHAAAASLRFVPIHTIDSALFLSRLAAGSPVYSEAELRSYVREELRLLGRLRPDVVVGDFRVTLGISTELLGIPYLALAHAHWSPASTRPFPLPEHPAVSVFGPALAGCVFPWIQPAIFRMHVRFFNRVRRSFGLAPVKSLQEMYTRGTCTLYMDLPELAPVDPLPPGHEYLGPLPAEPNVPRPDWHDRLPKDKPVVYVSPGSSGDAEAMRTVVETLAQLPVTIMVSTAGRIALESLSANVFAADYLPGAWACRRADVVICNGGSGAVYQALTAGRPVLGVPSNMDQYFIMESVMAAGAGMLLRAGQATADRVRDAVVQLIVNEPAAARAREFAAALRCWNAPERFAAKLEAVLDRAAVDSACLDRTA